MAFVLSFIAKCELWPFCNGFDSLFCTDRHIFFLTFGHIATGRVNNDCGCCRPKPQEQRTGLALFADPEVPQGAHVAPPP
uniref:Putative secreted protein n=1 Tax=Ixodes ricinus TaxID=34613 RepID=A0A6B0U679_IXORI